MSIRKRIANWLFRPEYERIRSVAEDMVNDWRMIPYTAARQQGLVGMLEELDPQLVDLMVRNLRDYELVGGGGGDEHYRLSVVKQSRAMFLTDPVISFAVALWTDFAFGERPNLTAANRAAQDLWDEFWNADRNAPVLGERKLHKLSEDELVDGELFFAVFASTVDGAATLRTIPTEEIVERICDPDDRNTVLFYRRDYNGPDGLASLYYRDWHATEEQLARAKLPDGARRADEVGLGRSTDVVVLHAAYVERGGRGWPLATTGMDWERAYSGFLKDRAAVAKAAASVVEKIKAKGGQRAIDAIRARVGSSIPGSADSYERNPPPVAGSVWLENDALSREWMNRPTNAADAEKDGIGLITQVGLSLKVYPHYLGRGDYYRLATATAMETPMLKAFNRYQKFWSSVWRDLYRIVIDFAQKYGGKTFGKDADAQISSDRIIDVDTDQVVAAIQSVMDLFDRGVIGEAQAIALSDALLKTALEGMGMQGVDEMMVRTEAGEGQPPFESRFSEAKGAGIEQYRSSLKSAVYGLWAGKTTREEFGEQFELAIDVGLRHAWDEGMRDVGLLPEDMTEEERAKIAEIVLAEFGHVSGFADAIEAGSKAAGGKLAALQGRLSLWVNKYNMVRNQAKLMAQNNPPLTWEFGGTVEHCDDCAYARGRTYRASVWKKWGWEPQSRALQCQGYHCECFLAIGDEYTKLTPGHPRRPVGP